MIPYQKFKLLELEDNLRRTENRLTDNFDLCPSKSSAYLLSQVGESMSISQFADPHIIEVKFPKSPTHPSFWESIFNVEFEEWMEENIGKKAISIDQINDGSADWYVVADLGLVYLVDFQPNIEFFGYSVFLNNKEKAILFKLTWLGK